MPFQIENKLAQINTASSHKSILRIGCCAVAYGKMLVFIKRCSKRLSLNSVSANIINSATARCTVHMCIVRSLLLFISDSLFGIFSFVFVLHLSAFTFFKGIRLGLCEMSCGSKTHRIGTKHFGQHHANALEQSEWHTNKQTTTQNKPTNV